MLDKPQSIVDRLKDFQRTVRRLLIDSRRSAGLHAVSRASAADTIYQIDTVVEPVLEDFCRDWARTTPLVLIAEGVENEGGEEGVKVFPEGSRAEDAYLRLIVDPIDGTRGIMYDKRPAWALAGVAPNKGPGTRLRDIEVAVMTELPTSKMGWADVLWAIKGQGAVRVREAVRPWSPDAGTDRDPLHRAANVLPRQLAVVGRVFPLEADPGTKRMTLAVSPDSNAQTPRDVEQLLGYGVTVVPRTAAEIAALIQCYYGNEPNDGLDGLICSLIEARLKTTPSQSPGIDHGFASVANFFPGTKVLASELMEHLVRHLVGPADVTKATVFDDQYISTGGQFYEVIVGHDRFNADLRPLFYAIQRQPPGLCCHPYDCATWLVAEEAGVILTDGLGHPLDGPLDVTTGLSWAAYANPALHAAIEPLVTRFFAGRGIDRGWGAERRE